MTGFVMLNFGRVKDENTLVKTILIYIPDCYDILNSRRLGGLMIK